MPHRLIIVLINPTLPANGILQVLCPLDGFTICWPLSILPSGPAEPRRFFYEQPLT